MLVLRAAIPDTSDAVASVLALFSSVWSVYLFDRLYDVRRLTLEQNTPARHCFTVRNRKLIALLLVFSIASLFATLPCLSKPIWIGGAVLALTTSLYYAAFRFSKLQKDSHATGPWKEIMIALCFTGGVILCCLPLSPESGLYFTAFSLTLLFLSNCLMISKAESEYDRHHDPTGFFSSRSGTITLLPLVLPGIAAGGSLYIMLNPDLRLAGVAILLSALASLWINRPGAVPRFMTQAMADLALLIPPAVVLVIHGVLSR